MKNFFIKKGNTLPDIKLSITDQMLSKYDITDDMMENVAVTFSMIEEKTGNYRIANVGGGLTIKNNNDYDKLDDSKYEVFYCFRVRDTRKEDVYLAEFKLDFLGDHSGGITFPIDDQIRIHVVKGMTKTSVISTTGTVSGAFFPSEINTFGDSFDDTFK